jgi:predicted small metal-binding protein
MVIKLVCKDYGYDCDFVAKGENVDDVMKEFGKHSDEEHGLWYSDESLKQIVQNKYNIK